MRSDTLKASALLVISSLVWGLAWPIGRLLALDLPVMSIAAARYVLVVVLFFALLKIFEKKVSIQKSWVKPLTILGLLNATIYQAFFLFGVRYTSASDASLIIGISPAVVSILAVTIGETLTKNRLAGLVLGFTGVAIIATLSPNTAVLDRFLGDALIIGAVLSHSLYTVLLKKFMKKTEISPLRTITWLSFFGLIMMVPFAAIESPWSYVWSQTAALDIIYLAVFSTVVGYLFFVHGVNMIGAGKSAVFVSLVPVFGLIFSVILLGEQISHWHLLSFALIFVGVRLASKS
ncbi:MAG: DMT family transporter [Candidatus Aenigmarchaeota archaeon]|nr:DMT family transporter [Candidatus Aenigmarchaeota archaeon]